LFGFYSQDCHIIFIHEGNLISSLEACLEEDNKKSYQLSLLVAEGYLHLSYTLASWLIIAVHFVCLN